MGWGGGSRRRPGAALPPEAPPDPGLPHAGSRCPPARLLGQLRAMGACLRMGIHAWVEVCTVCVCSDVSVQGTPGGCEETCGCVDSCVCTSACERAVGSGRVVRCTSACADTRVCGHVWMDVRECTGTCVHVCVHGSLCARGRAQVCKYLCVRAWTCLCTDLPPSVCVRVHVERRVDTNLRVHTRVCLWLHAAPCACKPASMCPAARAHVRLRHA